MGTHWLNGSGSLQFTCFLGLGGWMSALLCLRQALPMFGLVLLFALIGSCFGAWVDALLEEV